MAAVDGGHARCGVQSCLITVSLAFLTMTTVCVATGTMYAREELLFCPFFANRAPTAQPDLKNCTWFKQNSCCLQQEIEATFGRVKPLQGASRACQQYINYIMCYICAPNQNYFYKRERLTVCEEFCEELFRACGSATLKGAVIRDLYRNGSDFCRSRRFEVEKQADGACFTFDVTLDKSGGVTLRIPSLSIMMTLVAGWVIKHSISHWSLRPRLSDSVRVRNQGPTKSIEHAARQHIIHRPQINDKLYVYKYKHASTTDSTAREHVFPSQAAEKQKHKHSHFKTSDLKKRQYYLQESCHRESDPFLLPLALINITSKLPVLNAPSS